MGKIAIYARVSTIDKQDYARQISDCFTAIGDKYQKEDIEIFAEQISGYKKKEHRPQLTKLMNIIENDSTYFDCVYVTEISRLGRDPKETRNLIDTLTDKKIPIFITSINKQTLDENGERDSIMSIILQVLIEFSDSESKTMKKRSRSGLLESAKNKGNAGGGKYLPYGYTKDETKKLIIDEDESEIIKEIFQLYKAGNGCKKIAGYLNDKNVPTRVSKFGNQVMKFKIEKNSDDITWSDKTINDIIRNSIYKGDRKYKDIIISAPAIISTQMYDECVQIMNTKTHRNYLTTYTYALKDLLICGCCGRNYFAKFKPVVGGDKVYICSSRLIKGGNCGNLGVNISLVESAIYNEMEERLIHIFNTPKDDKEQIKASIDRFEKESISIQKQIDKIENRKDKVLELYESDRLSIEKYDERINEINNEEKELVSKLKLVSQELFDLKKYFDKDDNEGELHKLLIEAKTNRTVLSTVFKELIDKVVITPYGANNVIVDVYTNRGLKSTLTIRIVLDLKSIKMKPAQYKYYPLYFLYVMETTEKQLIKLNDIESGLLNEPIKLEDNLILIESTYPIK